MLPSAFFIEMLEPQNIEQGISNVEGNPSSFCGSLVASGAAEGG
jgi:hypothetical protein